MQRGGFFLFLAGLALSSSTAWSQTQGQLLAGAFTDVPASANPDYVSLVTDCPRCPDSIASHEEAMEQQCILCHEVFDNPNDEERQQAVSECIEERLNACHAPLHILSRLTGAEFHQPNKISSLPGGLSAFAKPILRKANGVWYWFISGELSGYLTDEFGQHVVFGPIDPKGNNHRSETFCAPCTEDFEDPSLCCEPNQAVPNPRAGLSGAFFGLSVPAQGFNGGLIQIEAAGDGGFLLPAAPLLFNPVDPVTLLERGYAVFTFGQGGTVSKGLPPGSEDRVVDTNPNSGSGIFWAEPKEANYDDPGGSQELESYDRVAFFNEITGTETTVPSDYRMPIIDPCCDDQIFDIPFGNPRNFYGSIHTNGEIISDTVLFAKNLVAALFPKTPVNWAAYVGWSGSGRAAVLIDSNTRAGAFQLFSGPPQVGGGDYNSWGDPSSGLRFDAFVSYAGANDSQGFMGVDFHQSDVNPELPISAPFVWLVPENDVTLPQAAAYVYANKVWRALEALGRGGEIDRMMRIFAIPRASHQARDQLFSAFDSHDGQGGLWYALADLLPNPGAFNEQRIGLRVSDPYAQALPFNGPLDGWDFFFHGKAGLPRDTALWLQLFADLREQAVRGSALPVSRVHAAIFDHIDEVSTQTKLPTYPTVDFFFPDSDEEFFAEIFAIEHSIDQDTGINFTPPEDEGPPIPMALTEEEVEELQAFADENPLQRSTKPLLLPDVAASLGTNFYFFDLAFQAPFTEDELKARYKSHGGYVKAFGAASRELMAEHLWDPRLGATYVAQAASSDILLAHSSKAAPKKSSQLKSNPRLERLWNLTEEPRGPGHGRWHRPF